METKKKPRENSRYISALIGLPIVLIVLIFGNKNVIDIFTGLASLLSIYEFYKCFKDTKKANPISIVGYIVCIAICFLHMLDVRTMFSVIAMVIPTIMFVLFLILVLSKEKISLKDVIITILGVCYIPLFMMFMTLIRNMDLPDNLNGKILIWFVFIASWGSDVFAYLIGRYFGKHKFTTISPNKTIEGCVAGSIGAIVIGVLFALVSNNVWNTNINYLMCAVLMLVLSVIGQVGDLAASSVKRYVGVKDFSEAIPGHGGILDRIDSIIFILPFSFFLLRLL